MNLDNHAMEVAYMILVAIAWLWTISQWRMALATFNGWRWSVTFWLTAKAVFLTNAGVIWWFNLTNPTYLEWSIYLLVVAHVEVFIHWLRLEERGDGFDGLPERTGVSNG